MMILKKCFPPAGGSFVIKTFGCKTNRADSEKIAAVLHGAGWSSLGEIPSLCIVNACCVTARSEGKALKAARAFKKTYPPSAGRIIDVSGKPAGPTGRQAPQPEGRYAISIPEKTGEANQ